MMVAESLREQGASTNRDDKRAGKVKIEGEKRGKEGT